jgi:serine/threonine-protein kinase
VSIPALAAAVAGEIANETDRAAFLRTFTGGDSVTKSRGLTAQPPAAASVSEKFSADMLRQAEMALARYIGAIAKVVVRRAAAKARDEAELYLLISDEIKDPAERKNFVRKAVSASRPR